MKFPRFVLVLTLILPLQLQAASLAGEISDYGMVASRSALASEVGADILARGGNAIDAAVAVGFALAVTYPAAGNLAGGGFMVIHLADGQVVTNDHRERAPAAATRNMFVDASGEIVPGLSTRSHLAVGVPGTVAGLLDVLETHGTMSRAEVIKPAIRLAQDGFPLQRDLVQGFDQLRADFAQYPASREVFTRRGEPYVVGDVFRQTDLAATLTRIKDAGRDGFYKGETARLIVADMVAHNGLISQADLDAYQSVWRQPIRGSYKGYEVISMPPPSSGGVLLVQLLNMLEPLDIERSGFGSATTIHAMIEAERRAYADRAEYLGDPDFYPVPVARLIDKAYAIERFADFDPTRASLSDAISAGQDIKESADTTHVSVMDAAGNAVAYTTTLNLWYGTRIVAAGTGMLLNNEMDDFAAKPDAPNYYGLLGRDANAIEPGKRMLSSMSPTIVLKDGKPLLVTGSPGGSTIITTTLQVILNVIAHGMSLSEAVASPRFHHQWQPDQVMVEQRAFSPDTRGLLQAMGHKKMVGVPSFLGQWIGDANSVMRTDVGIVGVADPRNPGAARGVSNEPQQRPSSERIK